MTQAINDRAPSEEESGSRKSGTKLPDTPSDDEQLDLAAYVAFLEGIPVENAIARRFVSAAHLLARAVLVNTVFGFMRGLDFNWEDAAAMTGDILGMSRSSVARQVSDMDRLLEFWNATGFSLTSIDEIVEQVSDVTKKRLAGALEEKADED